MPVSNREILRSVAGASATKHDPPFEEGFWRSFFRHSLDLLCVASVDGYFLEVNPAWTRLLGYSPACLCGQPFIEFVHPLDRAATRAELQKLAAGAPVILFENRYRARSGAWRHLQWTAMATGTDGLIYAAARDLTAQRELETRLHAQRDEEQLRLSHELHDGVCQELTAATALAVALARKLERAARRESVNARELSALLGKISERGRQLAHGLNPVYIPHRRLGPALAALARQTQRCFGIACRYAEPPDFPRLKPRVGLELYRIAQEAVTNAARHADAQQIRVQLERGADTAALVITDNGRGLPRRGSTSPGLGLQGMRYRARLVGASLEIARAPRGGTRVRCVFPLAGARAGREAR